MGTENPWRDWFFDLCLNHWWGFIPFVGAFVGMIVVSIMIFAPIIIVATILYVEGWKWVLRKFGLM